jgi:hypothetical protein
VGQSHPFSSWRDRVRFGAQRWLRPLGRAGRSGRWQAEPRPATRRRAMSGGSGPPHHAGCNETRSGDIGCRTCERRTGRAEDTWSYRQSSLARSHDRTLP